MTINNERLAKFEGKCWHETTNEYPFRCAICGQSETDWQGWFICPHNPNYSTSPDDRERLWLYLMGKPGMYICFENWAWDKQQKSKLMHLTITQWLFSPLDGVPRWVSLLSEWLGMESTRERFGWVECPTCENKGGTEVLGFTVVCPSCSGTGKVRAEWAR